MGSWACGWPWNENGSAVQQFRDCLAHSLPSSPGQAILNRATLHAQRVGLKPPPAKYDLEDWKGGPAQVDMLMRLATTEVRPRQPATGTAAGGRGQGTSGSASRSRHT